MFGFFRKKAAAPEGPDLSGIDSREKTEELYRRGELERIFLLPADFGGEDAPPNILYVPIGIGQIKERIDNNVIAPLAAKGKITKYKATPEYSGKSFIPIAIKIVASNPGEFVETIEIWGEALQR